MRKGVPLAIAAGLIFGAEWLMQRFIAKELSDECIAHIHAGCDTRSGPTVAIFSPAGT